MYAEQGLVAVGNVVSLALLGYGALVGLVPGLFSRQGVCLLVKPGLNNVGFLHQPLSKVLETLLKSEETVLL